MTVPETADPAGQSTNARRDPRARAVVAPAEGVPVSDLITITGMSRRWVFYRLRQLTAEGYAVQTGTSQFATHRGDSS
jgi:hypothetical protein